MFAVDLMEQILVHLGDPGRYILQEGLQGMSNVRLPGIPDGLPKCPIKLILITPFCDSPKLIFITLVGQEEFRYEVE